jgi:anti-sigma factor RsiW
VIELARGCSRYRVTLIDFVDRGEVRAETSAALAHLDRCIACTEVVESTILTITALRRMGDEASGIDPPPDSWPRLRVRIQGWRRRPAVMSPLAGLAMSFAIVAVLVFPVRFGGTSLGPGASSLVDQGAAGEVSDREIEAAYIASVRQGGPVVDGSGSDLEQSAFGFPRNPDNYRPTRKEVGPVEPNGRPPEAI